MSKERRPKREQVTRVCAEANKREARERKTSPQLQSITTKGRRVAGRKRARDSESVGGRVCRTTPCAYAERNGRCSVCKHNIVQRFEKTLFSRMRRELGTALSNKECYRILGCDMPAFLRYISALWQVGMAWSTYAADGEGWVLDHIKPLNGEDVETRDVHKRRYHYTNVQPLWAKQNRAKGAATGDVARRAWCEITREGTMLRVFSDGKVQIALTSA